MTKFKYVNDEKKRLKANIIYKTIPFNQPSKPLPDKFPGLNTFNKWDAGLYHRTKYFRNNSYEHKPNKFIDLNYNGGNGGRGFYNHNRKPDYKYNFSKTIEEKPKELNEEDMVLEEQRYQGADVRGFVRLDISRAKKTIAFRKKPRNNGERHSKGLYGKGIPKYEREEEILKKNNNAETYMEKDNEEFGDLFEGIKKEKLEYNQNKDFKNATDGI